MILIYINWSLQLWARQNESVLNKMSEYFAEYSKTNIIITMLSKTP